MPRSAMVQCEISAVIEGAELRVNVVVALIISAAVLVSDQTMTPLSAEDVQTIREELIERGKRDQRYRTADYPSMSAAERKRMMQEGSESDRANTAWVKALVKRIGWPGSTRFGADAAHAAFLILQHSDHDPEFQAATLPLITAAAEQGEASKPQVAFLTDRVRVKLGQPQLYGTQYGVEKGPDGSATVGLDGRVTYTLPIVEDVDRLDERRKAMGLGPWREYEARMAKMHGRTPALEPARATSR